MTTKEEENHTMEKSESMFMMNIRIHWTEELANPILIKQDKTNIVDTIPIGPTTEMIGEEDLPVRQLEEML